MDIIHDKIKVIEPSAIGGHIGDLVDIESAFGFRNYLINLIQ